MHANVADEKEKNQNRGIKAVILAAGMGNRLGELTEHKPKCMLSIGGKTLIERQLASLNKLEEISEILIITGFMEKKLIKHVREIKRLKKIEKEITHAHNPRYAETNNIYSIKIAEYKLRGSAFVLINSDVLFHYSALEKVVKSEKHGIVLAIDSRKKLGREEMKVIIEGSRIIEINKEIEPERAHGEYIGIARLDRESSNLFFDKVNEIIKSEGEHCFYEEAFRKLAREGRKVTYETVNFPWIEIDTKKDYEKAINEILPEIEAER